MPAGLAGLSAVAALGGLSAEAQAPGEQKGDASKGDESRGIRGPTVFEWEQMQFHTTPVGAVAPLCKQPTATLDQLEMHVGKLNPGLASHPPHRHVNEELIILREGECETLSDGKWVKVTPGSVVFNASMSLHGFRNVGSTEAVYHVINWSPNKGRV
jgi:mannose-6-phosphate isomerase-like protein (cupin superfamily)